MILLIDNYDGVVYNLYQLIGSIDPNIKIVRNDKISFELIKKWAPEHIVISGGSIPPEKAGLDIELIRFFANSIPIFGVCLGYRAICAAFGGKQSILKEPKQGRRVTITVSQASSIFRGIPEKIEVACYHSTTILKENIPSDFNVTAVAADGEVMAIEHKKYPLFGTQFHPESFMTTHGREMMENFLEQ